MRSSISLRSPNSDCDWLAASSAPHLKLRSTLSTSRSSYPSARAARRILSAASSASRCSSLAITYSGASVLARCASSASMRSCMGRLLHRLDGGDPAQHLLHQVVLHLAEQRCLFRFLGQHLVLVEALDAAD